MPVEFEVSDADIAFAESILLPPGLHFDDERQKFIKNFETIDLHAIPGSGKTTALLAKLLILERKLPFQDGSGILVISHTNAAIDEITEKLLHHCPRLFRFPNFIGTIQSFVNEFLAIPFFSSVKKARPIRIDNGMFLEAFARKYPRKLLAGLKLKYQERLSGFLLGIETTGNNLIHFHTHAPLQIPQCGSTTPTYMDLVRTKKELLNEGILNFNDTYFIGNKYLKERPHVKNYIRRRFSYAFVDEMQDMDKHQYELLEDLFYSNDAGSFQRIGDMNQSIYGTVKSESYWLPRIPELVLNFRSSQRFSQPIANVLKHFASHRDADFDIIGLRNSTIKPHIIKYDDETIGNVIPKFFDLISALKESPENVDFRNRLYLLTKEGKNKYPIKIISWNTGWSEQDDADNPNKIRLVDYWPGYNREKGKVNVDYECLKEYLVYCDRNKGTFAPILENIVNALLKILRLENITQPNGRFYTKTKLFDKLREADDTVFDQFRLKLFQWSVNLVKELTEHVLQEIINYLPAFLALFESKIVQSRSFISGEITTTPLEIEKINIFHSGELKGEICSVHSVKGQTHAATLYLESYYQKDGKGENAKSYESQRLASQFLGIPIHPQKINSRTHQSAKMAYVGFSRATDLLCVAIHATRFDRYLNTINKNNWEIFDC